MIYDFLILELTIYTLTIVIKMVEKFQTETINQAKTFLKATAISLCLSTFFHGHT